MKPIHAVASAALLFLTVTSQSIGVRPQDDCPPPIMFYTFEHEMRATVTAGAGINLRAEPSTSGAIVADVPAGADILLDEATPPVCADGYRWQRAHYAGLDGWAAEGRGGDAGYNLTPVILRGQRVGRVSYQYDERLAGQIDTRAVAPEGDQPGYDEAQFNRYEFGVGITEQPRYLRVYRTSDFAPGSAFGETVEQVRDLLHARINQEPFEVALPLLPPLEGSDPHHAQAAFVDFDGGSGVRTLVVYTGANGSGTLVYRFVGLTNDGDYLMSMTFPLQINAVAASTPEAVATEIKDWLPRAFTPGLDLLDRMAASIHVDRAEGVVTTDPTTPLTEVAFGNMRFALPSTLARRVEFDLVAPDGDIARMSMAGPQPGRVSVQFVGYLNENTLRDPILNVIDDASAPAGASQFTQGMERLRDFLETQPALATAEYPEEDAVAQRLVGGPEALFIQPEYVAFAGGHGVRYLTTFSQNYVFDVQPHSLYYVFEGLSDDGRYQIYAIFPVGGDYTIATPPWDLSAITGGVEAMQQREREYIAALSRELDGVAADAFAPGLDVLDGVIESLVVG